MTQLAAGIGLKNIDHIAITVPDLKQATEFFSGVLGFKKDFSLGPIEADASWMSENLDVGSATALTIQVLTAPGSSLKVELLEFSHQNSKALQPRRDAIGTTSIGLHVEDFDAAVANLRENGAAILGAPKIGEGPIAGTRWVYAKAPWGLLLFIMTKTPASTGV